MYPRDDLLKSIGYRVLPGKLKIICKLEFLEADTLFKAGDLVSVHRYNVSSKAFVVYCFKNK
jgi:hypothetical protein